VDVTFSIRLNEGEDLAIVGEIVALLERHGKADATGRGAASVFSRLDVERAIRDFWADPVTLAESNRDGTWQELEAYEQADVLHNRLPDTIWRSMLAAAEFFSPGEAWTAADLAAKTGWGLEDVRQRLRNIPRSRAVREYVEQLVMRLGLDPDDRDLFETVKNAALQFSSESDGRVVHYTMTPELAPELMTRGYDERDWGTPVDEDLHSPEDDPS
jgi:hypothetical protein